MAKEICERCHGVLKAKRGVTMADVKRIHDESCPSPTPRRKRGPDIVLTEVIPKQQPRIIKRRGSHL